MKHMKTHTLLLFAILLGLSACKKEEAKKDKTILLHKRSFVQGTASWSEELQYDANGKVTGFIATNSAPTLNYTGTFERNSEGNVSRLTFSDGRGHTIYEHDARGRLVKSSGYSSTGTLSSYEIHTYFDDRYETTVFNNSGNATNKLIYYYTADKKNIATRKQYNSSGVQTQEISYTYAEGKNNYVALMQSSPFIAANMIATEVTKTFSPSATSTATASYTYNADGYAATINKTYTNGFAPLTGTYEYTSR